MFCGRLKRALSSFVLLSCAVLASTVIPTYAGISCHIANGRGPAVAVSIKRTAALLRTGDHVLVEWNASASINPDCRTPLFLVLSTPKRTRFEGERFLALPPNAEGPYGISYQLTRTRIFVPLHLGPQEYKGTVAIKVYEAGPLTLDWALLEMPAYVAHPKSRADLAVGHEIATGATEIGQEVTIVGGNPAIVVRDRFTAETPKKIVRSNSGEFELQVFDNFYRVIDLKTEELILERAGVAPNFSPSSRYMGAFGDGPGLEIIDLYAGQVVTSGATLSETRGFLGNAHLAAWSANDAILGLSVHGYGGIEVQQALVDGSQRSFPSASCHACAGIYTPLIVDLESWDSCFARLGPTSRLRRELGKPV